MDRRKFMQTSAAAAAGLGFFPALRGAAGSTAADLLYDISLAQWSLYRTHFSGEMNNLDFPRVARETFGIVAIEYVNTFMREESREPGYVTELKNICNGEGVTSLLIMCDSEGRVGDPDEAARITTVENHYRWVDIAVELGCHSIRVNAASDGDWNTQRDLAADGLRRLTEFADRVDINVIVENHGGISSNGAWLAEVIRTVDHPRCGTLPDFGNFYMGEERGWYDIYQGVEDLMPFAKGVSAKTHNFDDAGNERDKDYLRLLRIVLDAGYRGYVGVEYEGNEKPEAEGILLTKALLERCRETLTPEYA